MTISHWFKSASAEAPTFSRSIVISSQCFQLASAKMRLSAANHTMDFSPQWLIFDQVDIPMTLREVQAILADRQDIPKVVVEIDKAINSILGRQIAKDEKRREKREKIEKTAEDFIRESQREPDFTSGSYTPETAKVLPDFQI